MWYINLNVHVVNPILDKTHRSLKFHLKEHNPLKSNHHTTNEVKHSYSPPDHFVVFKNPEILASALNHHKLLIKRHIIQEQPPEINVDQGWANIFYRGPH